MSDPKLIAITGASGLIGKALTKRFKSEKQPFLKLVRHPTSEERERFWNYSEKVFDGGVDDCDALVHLAGETVDGHWSSFKKRLIYESRVQSTRFLVEKILSSPSPPKVVVFASAIGFYGQQRADWVTEESPPGSGFLADVVEDWERASEILEEQGIRVVRLRLGVVLAKEGGALHKMLPVFRFGLGGAIGDGEQRMSWITLSDVVDMIWQSIHSDSWQGNYNAVAPEVVSNLKFSRVLAKVLKRPAILKVPKFMMETVFGEMADSTVLSDLAVQPKRLMEMNYPFKHPKLQPALEAILLK
ncbi:MAG: TIGR01777 family oxidoreductase [SAR324 cluster bacterium]|nr:TIGR01777 family oxidoreductase [SAR324 cluster bacterium]